MSLEEAILEKLRHLPPAKQEAVLRFADGLQRHEAVRMVEYRERTHEIRWLRENWAEYADQWVALQDDRLIAADKDALKVFAAAKAEGITSPFVAHVRAEDSFPFVPDW